MPIVQETIRPTLFAPPLPNYYVIDNKWFIFFIVLTLTLKTYKGNICDYFKLSKRKTESHHKGNDKKHCERKQRW